MCIAHLQLRRDGVDGFWGWLGGQLCVNNWGKAWPPGDLGQTNPQLKRSPLTLGGPEEGMAVKWWEGHARRLFFYYYLFYYYFFFLHADFLKVLVHMFVGRDLVAEEPRPPCFSICVCFHRGRARVPHPPPPAIWSGVGLGVEWMGWRPLMETFDSVEIKALARGHWEGSHCLSPHFVFIEALTGTNKLE